MAYDCTWDQVMVRVQPLLNNFVWLKIRLVPLTQLSKGMKQKVMIICAYAVIQVFILSMNPFCIGSCCDFAAFDSVIADEKAKRENYFLFEHHCSGFG